MCPHIDCPVVNTSGTRGATAHGILITTELREGRVRNLNREASSEASVHIIG